MIDLSNEPEYLRALDRLVDELFQRAYELEWTWSELAEEAELSYGCVRKLGERKTRLPMFRTVHKIAGAVGCVVELQKRRKGAAPKLKISWTPDSFAARAA